MHEKGKLTVFHEQCHGVLIKGFKCIRNSPTQVRIARNSTEYKV